ncbi:hypothetical protein LEP1GSC016_2640 [Leptospira borgpetersenii serovar Hardjo-bovis str. Sponselee]|uniref:Uncharacterized protein n=1 Tax=Leptospira borgpetersenii serovar Hardjo-bovis str. Sponselee TaxID=1303729 RepID=M6BUF0_LEPBO|nr:hypothetical protein LEP1GSC016_2640 [Leptospira borgpetersenii serovar Hardjo-bovis str. Sponselee]
MLVFLFCGKCFASNSRFPSPEGAILSKSPFQLVSIDLESEERFRVYKHKDEKKKEFKRLR